jgi:hypothetical protein
VTVATLMQTTSPERLEAIQRYLNREGTGTGFVLTLFGFAVFAAVLLVVYELQKRSRNGDVDRPGRLFRRLVRGLGLSVPQRDLVLRIGRDLGLENPTVILLGRSIFEAHAREWLTAGTRRREDEQRIARLADVLFPSAHRAGISTAKGRPAVPDTDA